MLNQQCEVAVSGAHWKPSQTTPADPTKMPWWLQGASEHGRVWDRTSPVSFRRWKDYLRFSLALWVTVLSYSVMAQSPPLATDIHGASSRNTTADPQSALIVLQGSDPDLDALSYEVVTAPAHGTLSDPENGDASVTTGLIVGQTLTYTPDPDWVGTDSFTYQVSSGGETSNSGTATLTVFDAYRANAGQVGDNIDGSAAGDRLGLTVALSNDGRIVAVAAPFNDGATGDPNDNRGHVRVYQRFGSTWQPLGSAIEGEAAGDESGRTALDLSNDGYTLAVGAYWNDGSGANAGHVRVYQWDGSDWQPMGADIDGQNAGDEFGSAVGLSADGRILAVGAPFNDSPQPAAGQVSVFGWDGSTWTQIGADLKGETAGARSGSALALSADGRTLAIGAPAGDSGFGTATGSARVMQWDGSAWQSRGSSIPGESAGDEAGRSLALSADGNVLALGSPYHDGDSGTESSLGQVAVYEWLGTDWGPRGAALQGTSAPALFGTAVALSDNGDMLAVGASSDGTNGTTQTFTWDGSGWSLLGAVLGGGAQGDRFGVSVSLAGDGLTLVAGDSNNDSAGANAGEARLYSLFHPVPTAVDVYAATLVNTASDPQSALVTLVGTDPEFDDVTYEVVTTPAFGTLTDPLTGSPITTGPYLNQTLTYTPNEGFTGEDQFSYLAYNDDSKSALRTATVTVYEATRYEGKLMGQHIPQLDAVGLDVSAVALSSNGLTLVQTDPGDDSDFGTGANSGRRAGL